MSERGKSERPPTRNADAGAEAPESSHVKDRAQRQRQVERRDGGRTIDDGARAPLEQSFGRSFSDVRVHEDGLAEDRGAQAVTQGKDIHFARGRFAPGSTGGRQLLAHELTHVVQQDGAAAAPQAKSTATPALADHSLEREADEIGARASAGHSVAGAIAGRVAAQAPQHFGSDEHKMMGDMGGGEFGAADGVELVPGYKVSYGDIVALAGDLFGTIEQLRDMARIPGQNGQKAGTRDEVEYARLVEVQGKNELASKFSDEVKNAVSKRYYGLAVKNVQHFDNPKAGDQKRDQADKDKDRDGAGHGVSAGSTYRENHDAAIALAVKCGKNGKPIDDAVATEAFGHHFLTDSFSSGHTRTPRGDVKEYWNSKLPMFFYNFKTYMAQETARHYGKGVHSVKQAVASVATTDFRMHVDNSLAQGSLPQIEKKFADKGIPSDFGFGEIVSGALHDYDNLHGVAANVDGQTVNLVGDGGVIGDGGKVLPGGLQTRDVAVKAVQTSLADVRKAYEAGKQNQDPGAVAASMQDAKGMYAAERMIPQALPDSDPAQQNKSIKWDYGTVDELLSDSRMLDAMGVTAREKASLFEGLANGLDEPGKIGFMEGVVNPLKAHPIDFLKRVINYVPDTGGGVFGQETDDEAVDYVKQARATPGGLRSLTMEQKEKLIADVMGGVNADDEQRMVLEVLVAKIDEAPALIQHVSWRKLWNKIDNEQYRQQFLSMFAEHWWHSRSYDERKTEVKNLAAFDAISQVSMRSLILIFRSSSEEEQQRLYAQVLEYDNKTQWKKQLEANGIRVRS